MPLTLLAKVMVGTPNSNTRQVLSSLSSLIRKNLLSRICKSIEIPANSQGRLEEQVGKLLNRRKMAIIKVYQSSESQSNIWWQTKEVSRTDLIHLCILERSKGKKYLLELKLIGLEQHRQTILHQGWPNLFLSSNSHNLLINRNRICYRRPTFKTLTWASTSSSLPTATTTPKSSTRNFHPQTISTTPVEMSQWTLTVKIFELI